MKLYDAHCKTCGNVQQDVTAESGTSIALPCPCGGTLEWMPAIANMDAKGEFYDVHFDRTFSSYHEMESYAKANGKAVLTPAEAENIRAKPRDHTALNESIQKSYYRLRHGYRDYPALDKE